MLPPDFRWHSVGTAPHDQPNALLLDSTEVLRLSRRVDDGTWYVTLNKQRDDWNARKNVDCSSYRQGKAGAEIWAERHQDRLRAEVDQRIKQQKADRPFLMR